MEFAAENFPMYQLLLKLKMPGIEQVTADFEAAKKGGDNEKYNFAMGLYTVATAPDMGEAIPGVTSTIIKSTIEQAYQVFEDTGTRGHPNGALMTSFMKATGQGTSEDFAGAIGWLDKAETLGGPSDFTRELRRRLSPVPFFSPKNATPQQSGKK